MPKQQSLKSQKGSTLVGMVALSTVMTLAAGGYLLSTATASKDIGQSSNEIALHYAAETGMQMGVRWMRNYWPTFYDATWAGTWTITPGGGYASIDGYNIKVNIQGNPVSPHVPLRTLTCWATAGAGQDTLKITWQMDAPPVDDASSPTIHCKPAMSNWVETLFPGKP